MNAKPHPGEALDDVLAQIAEDPTPPDAATLRAWTAQYPQFAAEIIEFATDWVELDAVRSHEAASTEDVDLVVNRTMSRVQALLDAADRPQVIQDLTTEITAAGHDLTSFERAIGVDRSILTCLIGRLVRPATVPARLVAAMAEALDRSLEAIRDFLRGSPQAAGAYKARQRPQATQADFAMLVQHAELSGAAKSAWLAEPPDPVLRE
jgi:hypothetical protein